MNEPIRITEVPTEYRVSIEGDKLYVWNDGNGRGYDLETLAPYTDDD